MTAAVNKYPRRGTVFSNRWVRSSRRAAQLNRALHQRIVGNKGVRPHSLHQFLFTDQPARVFHQIFKGFIDLGAELDLLSGLEYTGPCYVQRELAELID